MPRSSLPQVLFGLVSIAIGLFFCLWLWQGYQKVKVTRAWPSVSAVLEKAEVARYTQHQTPSPKFQVDLLYSYEWEGKVFTSSQSRMRPLRSMTLQKAENLVKELKSLRPFRAYVNPADPSQAILKHDTKAALYTIWFPGLLVVGGIGILLGAFRK
ncbi:MAG: DUF3592 domain-containing protein [Verrucomicrobiota bacterium]